MEESSVPEKLATATSSRIRRPNSRKRFISPIANVSVKAKMISDHADLTRVTYLFAAYRHYLKYRVDDNGAAFEVAEPWMNPADAALIDSENPIAFLRLSAFQATDLTQATEFVAGYLQAVECIKQKGAMATLESII